MKQKTGNGYLYVLPDLSRTPPFNFVPDDYAQKQEVEYVDLDSYSDAEVKAQQNFRLNFMKKLNLPPPIYRPLCSFVLDEGAAELAAGFYHKGGVFGNYFVLGNENGMLIVWKLPPRDKRIEPSLKIHPFACNFVFYYFKHSTF